MPKKATKYIFVTGGVLSGLGKGITAASIGNVLKARGLSVNIQKCDPYLNVDAGTLNPAEHGEAFVTYDGAETDLDLGHYERFLNQQLDQRSSLMSGRVLQTVIQDERRGEYLGKTVQIIPHVTDAIQDEIALSGEGFDVHIVEIGGTVGDYESLSFIEAIREFCVRVGTENCLYVHVVYVPYLGASKEFKTKPSQNAVRSLRSLGISPEVLVVRSEEEAPKHIIKKLSAFTGVAEEGIALLPNAETVYEVPLTLEDAGISTFIEQKLHLSARKPKLAPWRNLVASAKKQRQHSVKVGIIAKYMDNEDTYMSVFEALRAAGWEHKVNVDIEWINSEELEESAPSKLLSKLDGVLVPGGFGSRGVEGKIKAATYAMRTKTPYLGLCLGMQVGVIAFARQVLKGDVHTTEIQPDATHPVINLMEHQKTIVNKGGTMRLGDYECKLTKGSKTQALYQKKQIAERHRHRYEFNNEYRQQLEAAGLTVSGQSPDGNLVEIIELRDHPFFIGSQFHPEFTSRPDHPHPLFSGFIAELKRKKYNTKEKKG